MNSENMQMVQRMHPQDLLAGVIAAALLINYARIHGRLNPSEGLIEVWSQALAGSLLKVGARMRRREQRWGQQVQSRRRETILKNRKLAGEK